MRTNQKNKLRMFKTVVAKLMLNSDKLTIIPALASSLTKFFQTVMLIETKEAERSEHTTGKLEVRDEAEDLLVEILVKISSSLVALASTTNNTELYEKAKIKKSVLHRLRDEELLIKAKSMQTIAQQYAEQLIPIGITAEALDSFRQAIAAFKTASENVGTGFSSRTGARMSVNEAFDTADTILKDQIDNMMESVKKTDPQLYNEYWAARVIHDLGGSREPKNGVQTVAPPSIPQPA